MKIQSVSYKDIIKNKYNMAPHQLKILSFRNTNSSIIKNVLSRNIKKADNGTEVGTSNYISKSPYFVLRAKCLQENSFIPLITEESCIPIMPKTFIDYNLKEGDIIISKDSNIGETAIIDKDYPNYMLSGALYKLPINQNKYYVFAFLKSSIFKDQLDLLVPKGATIRHAGTKFVDCKIAFPNQKNAKDIINYVELLTKSVINKEKEIQAKYDKFINIIEDELSNNQIKRMYKSQCPLCHGNLFLLPHIGRVFLLPGFANALWGRI